MRFSSIPCLLLVLALGGLLASCTHFPLNAPLTTQQDDSFGYRLESTDPDQVKSPEVLLALSFSGGGTRAAALAYGVLETLRDIEIELGGEKRRLLDEVDAISAVSGGSIAAAYYALYGDRIFEDFENRFLKHNFQAELTRQTLSPRNWWRLAAPHFRRIDLLAEHLDRRLFEGKTFADLQNSPFLLINATDITRAARFDFTQTRFDLLCSDLDLFPIARAVAASAAVPVLLSPITVQNYGWNLCQYQGLASYPQPSTRRIDHLRSYKDAARRSYLHLFDGGLVDNLGIAGLIDEVFAVEDPCSRTQDLHLDQLRHVVVIIVNAVTELDRSAERTKKGPGLAQTIWAAANIPIDRTTIRAAEDLRIQLQDWTDRARQCTGSSTGSAKIQIHPIFIDFESVEDPALRTRFLELPTTFQLKPETVDALRQAAGQMLHEAYPMKQFLQELERNAPN